MFFNELYHIRNLTLVTLIIQNGIVQALIWNIPYRSIGVERLKKGGKQFNYILYNLILIQPVSGVFCFV